MEASASIKSVVSNLKKEFTIEFRNRFAVNVALSFAAISTIAISLALGGIPISPKMKAVLFWIIMFFSAMNGLSHIFTREEEEGTSLFLRLNVTPESILSSKLIFNIIIFLLLQIIITPLYIFFLQVEIKSIIPFLLTLFTGGLSLASITTILAAIVAKAGGKGSLFTIISFPLVLPVLWIVINSTFISLDKQNYYQYNNLLFLLAFSATIIAVSFLLFKYIWLEE